MGGLQTQAGRISHLERKYILFKERMPTLCSTLTSKYLAEHPHL